MDDDLFIYEVEIPGLSSIPCDKKEGDDSDDGDLDVYEPRAFYDKNDGSYAEVVIFVNKRLVRLMDVTVDQWLNLIYGDHKKVDVKKRWVTRGIDADMEYDPSDVEFAEWLASKLYNHMTMDRYTINAFWIYWTRGDDEVELIDKEFSDPDDENLIDKDEVAKVFRIETNIFDFETPICKAFNEFNYLLKIDTDLLTSDILGFKTYDEFKNEWIDEWNKGIPWVPEEPWSKNGIPIDDIIIFASLSVSRMGKLNGPLAIQMMPDGKLKEEALKKKTIYERSWGDATQDNASYHANKEEEQYEEDRCELLGNPCQEPPVCKIGRFEVIKYSFGPVEEYIAIKEYEYNDLTRTEEDACHDYHGIFRIMDEG
ncbi:VIER F-box protein 2 [Tanacetum coccineum]|uniref:VIER F-box protein 2 n=1 Tax=Tanacetum coccineum TaxID=301880 RepID=A0ABQ5ASB0_9ASTR